MKKVFNKVMNNGFRGKKRKTKLVSPAFHAFHNRLSADTNCQVEHTPNDYEKKRAISCKTILLAVQKYELFEYDLQWRFKLVFR